MSIFDTFKETMFVKTDSNLDRQLQELQSLQKTNKSKELDKDIRLLEYGIQGEKEITYELKNANLGLYVLRDVTIEYEDSKAQIDYVIISKGYVYLVECKNLIGNIYIDNTGQFQREYILNNQKIKESIYSPYTQAVRHKEILKKRWMSHNNKLLVALREKAFDNLWYKPLVVLANSKSILSMKYAPKEIKDNVIRVDQLVQYISNDLKKYDKDLLSSKKNMKETANIWLKINVPEYHSLVTKYQKNNNLLEELKEYRLNKSKKMNIPAYYIFNDEELNTLVLKKPSNINELNTILSQIKIKCHGEEIINIINKRRNI